MLKTSPSARMSKTSLSAMDFPRKISSTSQIEFCHNQLKTPIFHPTEFSSKLKNRKILKILEKYPQLKTIFPIIKNDFKILSFDVISEVDTQEDKLVSLTHKKITIQTATEKATKHEILVPVKNVAQVKVVNLDRVISRSQKQYKCLYDYGSILFVSMVISINSKLLTNGNAASTLLTNGNALKENEINELEDIYPLDVAINFELIYINVFDFTYKRFSDDIFITKIEKDLEFTMTIKDTVLAIVWPNETFISTLDMSQNHSKFQRNGLHKEVGDKFTLEWRRHYLAITEKDHDFMDNVFSAVDVSKRRTVFYKVDQGSLFGHEFLCSHKMLTKIYEKENLDYPSDIIFVDIPGNPLWIVKEWYLPEITLKKLLFYYENSDVLKTLDFTKDFHNYDEYFQTPDEFQMSGFQVCNLTWQLFLWSSKQHILVINLTSHKIDYILELTTKQYFDFRNEFHNFDIDLTRFGKDIRIYIQKGKDYVHFERFQLPRLFSLKELAKLSIVGHFSKDYIKKCSLESCLKEEVLMIY